MKFSAFFYLVTGSLLLNVTTDAQETATAQKPYTALVSRNIFGLVPVPPPAAPEPPPIDPPPKITPNGIINLFGKYQVLFKTPGKSKNGLPPKEESYMMGEGERQDDIEVKKIDEKVGLVTFDNHGVIQSLTLIVAQNVGPVAGPGGQVPTVAPGVPPSLGGLGGGRFGRPVRPNKNVTTSADVAPSQPNLGGNNSGGNNPNASNVENLSPEAQVIMIEKNRIDTQQQVDAGSLPPLPPTPLTPADATAQGGSSLIAP